MGLPSEALTRRSTLCSIVGDEAGDGRVNGGGPFPTLTDAERARVGCDSYMTEALPGRLVRVRLVRPVGIDAGVLLPPRVVPRENSFRRESSDRTLRRTRPDAKGSVSFADSSLVLLMLLLLLLLLLLLGLSAAPCALAAGGSVGLEEEEDAREGAGEEDSEMSWLSSSSSLVVSADPDCLLRRGNVRRILRVNLGSSSISHRSPSDTTLLRG